MKPPMSTERRWDTTVSGVIDPKGAIGSHPAWVAWWWGAPDVAYSMYVVFYVLPNEISQTACVLDHVLFQYQSWDMENVLERSNL